jgi:Ca2+-binding EF-hand superfamily protein
MKKTVLTLTAALMMLAGIQTATANEERQPPPSFEQMDSNGDGELSQDELRGPLLEQFDQLDADGNGTLSEDEMPNMPPPPRRDD